MHSSSIDASSQDNTRPGCFIEVSPQVSCPIRMLDLEFGVGIYLYRLRSNRCIPSKGLSMRVPDLSALRLALPWME